MNIANLDKILNVVTVVDRPGLTWMDAAEEPFVTYGAVSKNPYLRLPDNVAAATSKGVHELSKNTSGIRLRFRTDSPYIALRVKWSSQCRMPHMAYAGISGFDLYTENVGRQFYVHTMLPSIEADSGYESCVDTDGVMRDYVLNFPLYNPVEQLYIGVQEGCQFEKPATYANTAPVVFYGSSITQGGCASRPGNSYQNMLSRRLNMDYVNLGFSGNGMAEPIICEYMAGLAMAAFVSDYDYNAETVEYLRDTHYRLYETIREKHPDLPYIMMTKPDYEDFDKEAVHLNDQRRAVIMESYVRAIEAGDRNVYFVDGATLFGDDQSDSCTVDNTHPNDLGFFRMYRALCPVLERILYLK
ncbi:MAG: SGNH/GDSL hydrolase family protein [Clostridia bacterium]|nr:SGNH/GDSL hydrolase family protein [Clostridia bacterium]